MTSPQDHLRDLLHRLTPEPPSQITAEQVRAAGETITTSTSRAHDDIARRSRRGRRWLPLAAAVAVAVVAATAAVVAAVLGSTNHSANPSSGASPATTSARPSTPSSTSPAPASGAPCLAEHLTASVLRQGSNASSPFIIIGLRNQGPTTCTLTGYPAISVFSATSRNPLTIAIHHGTYEQPDPGPNRVVLQPGALAWFAMGTGTAYQGGKNAVIITRITIALPTAPGAPGINLDLGPSSGLGATANPGMALPVGITAFASGGAN
jgi:Protein of unknown function (DUF4232)